MPRSPVSISVLFVVLLPATHALGQTADLSSKDVKSIESEVNNLDLGPGFSGGATAVVVEDGPSSGGGYTASVLGVNSPSSREDAYPWDNNFVARPHAQGGDISGGYAPLILWTSEAQGVPSTPNQ